MARHAGRDLTGFILDTHYPLDTAIKSRLQSFMQGKFDHVLNNSWYYSDVFERIKTGKVVSLQDFLKRTIIYDNLRGYVSDFKDGEIFRGLAKTGLFGITLLQVGTETYQAYQKTQDPEKTGIVFLKESLRWLIGKEVGHIGFAMGGRLSKEKWYLAGFFMASLLSAITDYLYKKYFRNHI